MKHLSICILFISFFSNSFAQSNFEQAMEKSKQADYKSAIKLFSKAIDEKPTDAVCYFERGKAYDKLEKSDEALYDYNKAVELSPTNVQFLNTKGTLEAGLADYKDAILTYSTIIKLQPSNDEAYLNRAFAKNLSDDKKGAQADMMKAMSLNSKYAQPEILNGVDYYLEGNKELACTEWKKVNGVGKAQADNLLRVFCTDHSRKKK